MAPTKKAQEDGTPEAPVTSLEKGQEVGFLGTKVDPTPNENYTVDGVTAGAPTPETDAALAAEAGASPSRVAAMENEQPPPNEKG